MKKPILVTGGAGYIGSHTVKLLGVDNESLIVLDDLSTGLKNSVLYGELIVDDFGNEKRVTQLLGDLKIDTVMHFAAHTSVPESVSNPEKYYKNNVFNTFNLLKSCKKTAVKHFIFSSSCAVYGMPTEIKVPEVYPPQPINPYGNSKLFDECLIRDLAATSHFRYVNLRYFNVGGADPDGAIGQSTQDATSLIKVITEVMVGKRPYLEVFGTDYPTPDGSCIRDYVHVSDIAAAHLSALTYLRHGGESVTLNCGYGHGYSVLEVIQAAERVSGKKLDVHYCPRRLGDTAAIIADVSYSRKLLNWTPKFDSLDFIIKSAWEWEKKLCS